MNLLIKRTGCRKRGRKRFAQGCRIHNPTDETLVQRLNFRCPRKRDHMRVADGLSSLFSSHTPRPAAVQLARSVWQLPMLAAGLLREAPLGIFCVLVLISAQACLLSMV